MTDLSFRKLYQVVKPIVLKLRSQYHIKLWDSDDWHQEGMIILFDLIQADEALKSDAERLRIYFKTKFSNHVKDVIRKQESQKRRFNRLPYEEIGEIAHMVHNGSMDIGELVAFNEAIEETLAGLSGEEKKKFDVLASGASFKGKKQFQRKLRGLSSLRDWGDQWKK